VLTVYITPAGRAAAAVVAAQDFFASHASAFGAVAPMFKSSGIAVQPARYTFRQLYDWYQTLNRSLGIPGITMGRIDASTNQVSIGVKDAATLSRVAALAKASGIPDTAIAVSIVAPFHATTRLTDQVRPTVPGLQVSSLYPGRVCTLGYTFHAVKTVSPSVVESINYFVLPSHCTATFGVTEGTIVGQPNVGSVIGHEVYDPPTTTGCAPGRQCRRSDAALFQYDASVSTTFAKVAHAANGSTLMYPFFPGPYIPYTITGMGPNNYPDGLSRPLYKVGAVTGETVTNSYANGYSCTDVPLYDQSGNDTGITLQCQETATLAANDGDSGGPMYVSSGPNGTIYATGMLWGKNGTGIVAYTDITVIIENLNHYPHLVSINYELRVW